MNNSTNPAAGPWSVSMLERPQLRPYFVARQLSESHWEQLRDETGAIARFETADEARAAIDKATA